MLRDDPRVSYACAFALACVRFDVPRDHACVAFAFAWLENMVLCAIKLVPLGQRAGQRMTFDLSGGLWQRCESAMSVDQALIAAGAPGQALASAQHEMQPTRLFRS